MTILPTQLTPSIIQAFADAARRGVPVETTCQILDIPERTFYHWLSDAERSERDNGSAISNERKSIAVALVAAIKRAQAECEAERVEKLLNWRSSKTGDDDWRQHAWFLTHGPSRTRWFEHRQTTVDQTIQVHHAHTAVRELSNEELLALEQQIKALEPGSQ